MANSEAEKPPKPILCKECKATDRIRVKDGRDRISVVEHRTWCTKGDYCMQFVSSGTRWYRSSVCGRPAKGHDYRGAPACGVHLRAERERARREEEYATRRELNAWREDEVEEKARIIREATGLDVKIVWNRWDGRGQYREPFVTGKIELDPDALIELFVEVDE